jgi:leucyl aminopeptidase
MRLSVKTGVASELRSDLLAVPLFEVDPKKPALPARVRALDRALGGGIAAAIASGDFRGRPGQSTTLYPGKGSSAERVLLLGMGAEAKADAEAFRRVAGRAVGGAAARRARRITLLAPGVRSVPAAEGAQALAEGALLGAYGFSTYQQKSKDEVGAKAVTLLYDARQSDLRNVRSAAARGVVLAESQNLARDLSNEPANELPPVALAAAARKMSREVGLRCRVLDVPAMKKLKMGAILAVGGGSANPPRFVVMEHNAPTKGGRKKPTFCIVGKGITFDSGGISIKPAGGMQDMKHDMSGAASVVGAMRAVALLKLPIHVVGLIAAAENMPSGTAYRPGDIVRSMSGKTIEILNTDAEGRVVLADALHYATTHYSPQAMVDLATLTGACMIALGSWATGVFGTNDALVQTIAAAGDATAERAWPMPLLQEHRDAMRSQVADLKNAGGREAGASTAAGFLAAFTGDTPWVHLDIAGTGWMDKAGPYQGRGATGVGVRLLLETLARWKPGA